MKTVSLAFCIAFSAAAGAQAQQQARTDMAGKLGLGVTAGMPTGVTAKYWLDNAQALDFGFGIAKNLAVTADYLWHGWRALPQPREGQLLAHVALGMRIEDGEFALRTLPGVDYMFARAPVELFAQVGPSFRLTSGGEVSVDGVLGVRYYFSPSK